MKKTEGSNMVMQPGWMEQRKHERVAASLKVSYRVLDEDEKRTAIHHPFYSQTTAEQLPYLAKAFNAYRAVTKNISEGGIAVSGEYPFSKGEHVEIELQLPECSIPVKFLTTVVRTTSFMDDGKTKYTAGVKILAVNRDDMKKLNCFLLEQKLGLDRVAFK
jgi:hypothetical protein